MTSSAVPEILGVSLSHLVAGGLGGVVRAITRPEQSWLRRSAGAVAGAFLAGFMTPVAAPIAASFLARWNVPPEALAGVCGFVFGLTGLSLCEGAIRLADRWRNDPKLPPFAD